MACGTPRSGAFRPTLVALAAVSVAALPSCASFASRYWSVRSDVGRDLAAADTDMVAVEAALAKLDPLVEEAMEDPQIGAFAVEALHTRVDAYLRAGRLADARKALERAEKVKVAEPFHRMEAERMVRKAILAVADGDREGALAAVEAARQVLAPPAESWEPFGVVQAYVFQSLGLYDKARDAAWTAMVKGDSRHTTVADAIYAWHAYAAGDYKRALVSSNNLKQSSAQSATLAFQSRIKLTGALAAESEAKRWLRVRTPASRSDWLGPPGTVADLLWIPDFKRFYRADILDSADLDLLAAYAVAAGPNLTPSGFADPLPPWVIETAKKNDSPRARDCRYAQAIWTERHERRSEKVALAEVLYSTAFADGPPSRPEGLVEYARFLAGQNEYEKARSVLARGEEWFPDAAMPRLMQVAVALRSGKVANLQDALKKTSKAAMNQVEREIWGVAFGVALFTEKRKADLERFKEEWPREFRGGVASVYLESLRRLMEGGTLSSLSQERDNALDWRHRGKGDPQRALVWEWFALAFAP